MVSFGQILLLYLFAQNRSRRIMKFLRHRLSSLSLSHFDTNTTQTIDSNYTQQNGTLEKFKHSLSEMPPFVILGICLAVVLVITIIVVTCCRKYHTRHLYQQSPQNFSSKPNLSLPQLWKLDKKICSLTRQEGQSIVLKETYDGKFYQVTFKAHNDCIYLPVQQKSDCYFQIEIIQLSSVLQIGFVPVSDLQLICKQSSGAYEIDLDQYGVSVRTDGTTVINGNNQINFKWKIEYGDTIGIGITKHNEGDQRVWITRNGIIQNPSSEEQRLRIVDVKNEGTEKTSIKKQKNDFQQEQKQKKAREEALNAKRKLEIKSSKKFSYYAVLISECPTQPRRQTIVNWNIGGQNFRLFDAKGLLG